MTTVAEFNELPQAQAAEMLHACCGASRWVSAMVARRPFESRDALVRTAIEIWRSLKPADWHEAFRYHPRIGEQHAAAEQNERGNAWSAAEQAGVASADAETRRLLGVVNQEYEKRFGHVYIVHASGMSAERLLSLARTRLNNAPERELQIAAGEQQQIMRTRLEKLIAKDINAGRTE